MTVRRYIPVGGGAVMDPDTGEISDRVFVAVEARKERSQFGTRWYSMSQDQSLAIARRGHELGLDGFRVMHYMASLLDYENAIVVSQADIAATLGMKRPNVSRAIKRLVEFGVIEKGATVAGMCSYRLSPEVGWKGKASNHRRILAERMKAARLRVVT